MKTAALSLGDRDALEQALGELRRGAIVALRIGDAAALLASAETIGPARFAALLERGAVLALTARRAAVLKLRAYDGDLARLRLPGDASLGLAHALADPALDLDWPMKGPFDCLREGGAAAERLALRLCKRARLLPAALVAPLEGPAPEGLLSIRADALERAMDADALTLTRFSSARVPLALAPGAAVHGFRPSDGGPDHFAIVVGDPPRGQPVLTRAHSECYTGDQLGSLKCDCGPQLRAALAQMAAEGGGVLLYLAQEGRGIGMANKLRAYALQDQGFDTVDANHRLGFEDDERDFRVAALMLRALGYASVRVLTNNPRKLQAFERHGLTVAGRVPLAVGRTAQNDAYLSTKAARSGHLL